MPNKYPEMWSQSKVSGKQPTFEEILNSNMTLENKANLINRYFPTRMRAWIEQEMAKSTGWGGAWSKQYKRGQLEGIAKAYTQPTQVSERTKEIMQRPDYALQEQRRLAGTLGATAAPTGTTAPSTATGGPPTGTPDRYYDEEGYLWYYDPADGWVRGGYDPTKATIPAKTRTAPPSGLMTNIPAYNQWPQGYAPTPYSDPNTGEFLGYVYTAISGYEPPAAGLTPSEEEQRRQWEVETGESKRRWEVEQQRLADQLGLSRQQLEQSQKQWAAEFGLTQQQVQQSMKQWQMEYEQSQGQYEQNLGWQKEQAAQQQAQQAAELAWQKEQWGQQLAQQQKAYLAQLAANPVSWLEYSSAAGQQAAVQPWMVPLGEQYGLTAGQRIPGYGATSMKGMPELLNPSAQYWARMGPTAQAQYAGYERARTGAMPEESAWRIASMAPPGGGYSNLAWMR